MSNAAWDQVNFLGGEWSPFAQGRIDLPTYRTALSLCSNAYPIEEGAWTRRVGTCHNGYTNRGKIARLFPYRFSQHNPTYQAEISFDGSNSWLRFWYTGELYFDGSAKTVSAVIANTPAKLTITGHGFSTGDDVVFYCPQTNFANNGATLLGRVFTVTKIDNNTITIADAVSGATFASSTINLDTTVTNKAAKVFKYQLPFTAASDLANVRIVNTPNSSDQTINSGAVLLILCKGYQPTWVYTTVSPTEPAFPTGMTAALATFTDGPYAVVDTPGVITASAASGSITITLASGALANGGAGWTSTDIGNPIRIYSEPAQWSNVTAYSAGDVVTTGTYPFGEFWTAFVANTGVNPTKNPSVWVEYPRQQGFWTVGHITAVADTTHCTVTIDGPAIYNSANVVTWLESSYSSYYGYPVAGMYDKGRLWLASLEEGKFDASYSNKPYNFAPSLFDGTPTDACSIQYQIPSTGAKPFTWMVSDPKGVLLSNLYGEFLLSAGSPESPITPTNIKYDTFTAFGSYPCEPVRCGGTVMFLQRSQSHVMEYLPDTFSGKFSGRILNINAQHLSTSFKRLEFQRAPTPILWATDGTGLYGCTYRRVGTLVSEEPKLAGWHKHTLSTGSVYDISQGATAFDTRDNLFLSTKDASSNYHVEYLDNPFDANRGANTAHFLDGSPGPGWTFGTATTIRQLAGYDPQLSSGSSGIQFFGLAHLVGKSVTIFVNGLNCGTQTVAANGSVTISYASDSEGLLTKAYMVANSGATSQGLDTNIDISVASVQTRVILPVSIGLTYTSEGQTLRPNDQQGAHLADGPGLAELRRVVRYGMLLQTSGAFIAGASSSYTYPSNLCTTNDQTSLGASTMFSGVYWDVLNGTSDYDGQLYWAASGPYPMTVMATASFVRTSERGVETAER